MNASASLSKSAPQSASHIPNLDGLRGIAALMIMAFHWHQLSLAPRGTFLTSLGHFATVGQTGVDLFFVLSGFLITRILINSRHDNRYFRNFYTRRALRIFPLYYGFLLFYYAILSSTYLAEHRSSAWWLLLYGENIRLTFGDSQLVSLTHFWTLAVEEHFYLFWPFVIHRLPKSRISHAVLIALGISLVTRALMLKAGYTVFYFTPCRLDGFAIGAFVASLEQTPGRLVKIRTSLVGGVTCLAGVSAIAWATMSGRSLELVQLLKYPFVALFYGFIVALAAIPQKHPGQLSLILNSQFLRISGRISYGLYVFHPVCYHYTNFLPLNDWGNLVVSFSSSGVVAWLSFNYFEQRFISLKKFFTPVSTTPVKAIIA